MHVARKQTTWISKKQIKLWSYALLICLLQLDPTWSLHGWPLLEHMPRCFYIYINISSSRKPYVNHGVVVGKLKEVWPLKIKYLVNWSWILEAIMGVSSYGLSSSKLQGVNKWVLLEVDEDNRWRIRTHELTVRNRHFQDY
jgi:hypothetical protein